MLQFQARMTPTANKQEIKRNPYLQSKDEEDNEATTLTGRQQIVPSDKIIVYKSLFD